MVGIMKFYKLNLFQGFLRFIIEIDLELNEIQPLIIDQNKGKILTIHIYMNNNYV